MIAKEQLEELYIKQNKLRREIAKELNISYDLVRYYLKKYNFNNIVRKIKKICPICGKCFVSNLNKHNSKYCSKKCFVKNKNLNSKKVQEYICDYCHKKFINRKCKINQNHNFCCEEHSKLWRKLNQKKPNRVCVICNKEFYAPKTRIKCCSKEC